MAHYVKTERSSNDGFTNHYSNISSEEILKKIKDWFLARQYKDIGNDTFEKGGRTARIFLGALSSYYKWQIKRKHAQNTTPKNRNKRPNKANKNKQIKNK